MRLLALPQQIGKLAGDGAEQLIPQLALKKISQHGKVFRNLVQTQPGAREC